MLCPLAGEDNAVSHATPHWCLSISGCFVFFLVLVFSLLFLFHSPGGPVACCHVTDHPETPEHGGFKQPPCLFGSRFCRSVGQIWPGECSHVCGLTHTPAVGWAVRSGLGHGLFRDRLWARDAAPGCCSVIHFPLQARVLQPRQPTCPCWSAWRTCAPRGPPGHIRGHRLGGS